MQAMIPSVLWTTLLLLAKGRNSDIVGVNLVRWCKYLSVAIGSEPGLFTLRFSKAEELEWVYIENRRRLISRKERKGV